MSTTTNTTGLFYPLSSAQSRIWFIENLNAENRAYNDPYDYRISGKLNKELFRKSVDAIVARHESFRTVFRMHDGVPHQVILNNTDFSIEMTDISSEPEEVRKKLIRDLSLKSSQQKFDLEDGPLFYLELIRLSDDEHILLMNFHHIISDAVSIRLFLDELFEIYNSLVHGKEASLPEIPLSYREYAIWENEWVRSEECSNQINFWKKELEGIPEMLQLPLDFPRPHTQRFHGAEYHFSIDENLRAGLSRVSKKFGTSMMIPVLSGFSVLLSKYSQQDDLVVGVPVANRPNEELQMVIGVLINTLPIRFRITDETRISELIDETKGRFLRSYENKNVPFEKLVEEMKIRRNLANSPVFQVMFNYLTAFQAELHYGDLMLHQLPGERSVSQVDLTMTVLDQKTWSNCIIQYDTDIFSSETIRRMAGHFLTILKAITEDTEITAGNVPILTRSEKEMMLRKWNETFREYPRDKCIHNLFEEQVLKTPDAIAVTDDLLTLTYHELNEKANKLAAYLIRNGATAEKPVALFTERNSGMIISLLAIVKSGAPLLPLDPVYPRHRIDLILKDAQPEIVITQNSLVDQLPEISGKTVFIDDDSEWMNENPDNPEKGNHDELAYIIFTSGSTGKPKGVRIRHSAVVNLVSYFRRILDVKPQDVLLSVTTIAFDIAELEVYLPLCSGAKLVIASKDTVLDMTLLAEKINDSGATIFQATPVTYRMLLMNGWTGNKDLRVICGGEALSKELAGRLLKICESVWNGYGPTETAIYSVVHKIVPEDIPGEGFVPIGRPVDNTTVYVLNHKLMPVPAGITGELYIGGEGVSPGYLNLPEITALRFIKDNFSGKPGAMLYKTGDIVKYYADGRLVFLERADTQVKIRGFRIELGEIESMISQYPGIKQNVVTVKSDPSAEKILVGYYIPEDGNEPDTADLKQFVRERLPEYMVPVVYIRMDSFPLTSNNKIDRKLLPEPDLNMKNTTAPFVEPQTPTEVKLAEIWASLLKIDKISVLEDFFEAGGHSMIAVTLIIRIEKEFGLRLPLASLFEQSTIRGMSKLIDEGVTKISDKWRSLVPIRTTGSKKPIFLVHGLGLNVLLYTTIVKWLDPEQPVYGLQARGLDGKTQPLETIEDIARWYIAEMMTVEPEGPYIIAGFSFGGRIAFEMARQLSDMGKEIGFLGLFDAVAEGAGEEKKFMGVNVSGLNRMAGYISWNFRSVFKNEDEDQMDVVKRKIKGLERKITGIDLNVRKEVEQSKGSEDELPEYVKHVHRANKKAYRKYIFKPYKGVVHLFKAKKQTFYIHDTLTYGWDKYALGGVVIHEIPGEHSSIFAPPNDKYFAEVLQRHLTSIHNEIKETQENT